VKNEYRYHMVMIQMMSTVDDIVAGVKSNSISEADLIFGKDDDIDGLIKFTNALKTNTSVSRVRIANGDIGGTGCWCIAWALCINETVSNLDITGCNVADGIESIATTLIFNTRIIHLSISHCRLDDNDALEIAATLLSNETIVRLELHHNNITYKGAVILARALEKNKTLRYLDVGSNRIATCGAIALAKTDKRITIKCLRGNQAINTDDEHLRHLIARRAYKTCETASIFAQNATYIMLENIF
jgi:hypothetical protein